MRVRWMGLWAAVWMAGASLPAAAQEDLLRQQLRAPVPMARTDVDQPIREPGDATFQFESGGHRRFYRVHVPRSYDPQHPAPLVVALHGGGGSMDYEADDANYGLVSASEQHGFVVAFPNGFSRLPNGRLATWNAGRCCGPARDRGVDDVGFIREMLAHLDRQLVLDPARTYATGMSNGAMMAFRLACEMPRRFAAIAAVAGTDNTERCEPAQPVSVLEIHARDDDHVPFEGGVGPKARRDAVTEFTSVPATIERWVQHDHCSGTPQRVLEVPGAHCDAYTHCEGGTEVAACVTERGAHSWPGAQHWRSSEAPSQAISATEQMWRFFSRHPGAAARP